LGIYLPKYLFDKYRSINALAESFVDSFKTELIAERTWRSVAQAELAIVEWVAWFNHGRLHSSIGDVPPVELEQDYAERVEAAPPLEQDQPLPSSVKLQDTEAT
jgi:putative transposase